MSAAAGDHEEIEAKLDVDADTELPSLAGLPGVTTVAPAMEHHLVATYLDTDDLALTTARVTLRRRTGGDDEGWHLKLPTGNGRLEVTAAAGTSQTRIPRRLRRAVFGLVQQRRLAPVVTVSTHRTLQRLLAEDGRVLAEVADDRVVASRPTAANRQAAPDDIEWREWEVELVDGDDEVLAAAVQRLRDAGAEPSAWPAKLTRALGRPLAEAGADEPPVITGESPASVLVRARIDEQVAELRRRDPLVRCDAEDAVHKMRVATRRLRSALATYRPLLDRRVTDPLRAELKWLAGELGGPRDAEVMRDRVLDMVDDEPRTQVRGRVRSRVRRDMSSRYRVAHAEALRALRSPRYLTLVDNLLALAAAPPFNEKAAGTVDDVLRRRVRHEWKRMRSRHEAVSPSDPPLRRAHELHEVRKAAKRLRYAGEPMIAVYGEDAAAFVAATESVQSILGDHHDSVVMRPELRRLADEAAADGDNAFTFGLLHAREEAMAAEREAEFADAWALLAKKKHRRWLKD